MAAIARFVSYDGGIAFSAQTMKIQKRERDAMTFPLDDVASVRVIWPKENADGFIRVETVDGRRFRIFFEDDQLREAVQFKKHFDTTVENDGLGDDLSTRGHTIATGNNTKSKPQKRKNKHVAVAVLCVVIIVVTVFSVVGILLNSDNTENNNLTTYTNSQDAVSAEDNSGELILDQNNVQIYFKGFSEAPAPAKGCYINLYIENNSNVDYMIQIDNLSVDGFMVPFGNYIFSPEILAGKKLNDHIWVTGMDELGITSPIKTAEFNFKLNEGNNLNNLFVDSDVIKIDQ